MGQIAALLAFALLGIGALPQVRRKKFQLFYILHHIGFLGVTGTVLLHAEAAWYFAYGGAHSQDVFDACFRVFSQPIRDDTAGLMLWFFDRLMRSARSIRHASVLEVTACGGITKLVVHVNDLFRKPFWQESPQLKFSPAQLFAVAVGIGTSCLFSRWKIHQL
eukprot:SAG31_NODE_3679_length_3994_cov_3.349422_3_plen_163_part_00